MHRITHGCTSMQSDNANLVAVEEVNDNTALDPPPAAGGNDGSATATALAPKAIPHFTYLFENLLQCPGNLLPDETESPTIFDDLTELGMTMLDADQSAEFNSTIPSAYTYFGQFVDHDITFTEVTKPRGFKTDAKVLGENKHLTPWSLKQVHTLIKNKRDSVLELDCVYGLLPPDTDDKNEKRKLPPRDESDENLMALSKVSKTGDRPPGKDDEHDLCRQEKSSSDCGKTDRVALIADPRNDSNLIVSQLHVAFLRAHNNIVKEKNISFEEAQMLLRQHYHWLIVHDFLKKRVADPDVVERVLSSPEPRYKPPYGDFSLPLEFAVAAYRFGHSMIRKTYYVNDTSQSTSLGKLFTLIVLGQGLKAKPGQGTDTLPENMIIQWEGFLTGGKNMARKINTRVVEPLFELLDEKDQPLDGERRLSVQDLKRGYMMKLPTGQAIANALEIENPLTAEEIEMAAVNDKQRELLRTKKFSSRTPLWFYILAEAAVRGKGNRLGPVGSYLVAEVLIGLIRRIPYSFLNQPGWKPTLGFIKKDEFDLTDLLRLAKVVPKNY